MCVYICLNCNPARLKRARYTFEVLLDTLGLPYTFVDSDERGKITRGILIQYGRHRDSGGSGQERLGTIFVSENWVENLDQIDVGFLSTPKGKKIPVLGKKGDEVTQEILTATGDPVLLEKDIVFSAFFFLSRWEEMESKTADKHGRFPTKDSISHKHGFSQRAVVNEYLKFLLAIISQLARKKQIPLLRKRFWPDGQKLAVCLSHDVDIIEKWQLYSLARAYELVKTGQLSSFAKTLWSSLRALVSGKNPALDLGGLASVEEGFSFKSSFYFMVGKPKSVLRSDVTYDLSRPKILDKVREVLANGFEVGLHASYDTFLNPELLLEEKKEVEQLIGSPISGLRQHFLRFKIPESWIDQKNSGFQYDTTLGFADQSGYRAGFAFPFYAYDLENDRKLDILELPLVAMDRTYSKYLSYSTEQIQEDIFKTFEELEDFGGLVTILWHTHMVDELGFSGYPQLYEKILDFMHQKGYFVAPAKEIVEWWERRKSLELKNHYAQSRKSFWEFVASDRVEKLTFETVGLEAENVRVDGCNCEIVREGQSTVLTLSEIKKGVKITFAIQVA